MSSHILVSLLQECNARVWAEERHASAAELMELM